MTDTPAIEYENSAIGSYTSKVAAAKIDSARFTRLVFEKYLSKVDRELGDDFSKLEQGDYAKGFAHGLMKDIGASWLKSRGASDEAIASLATDDNLSWLIHAATQGQINEESFSKLVIDHGENFSTEASRLFGALGSITLGYARDSAAYNILGDVAGTDVYKAIGEPELTKGVTLGMFEGLKSSQKASLIDLHATEGHVTKKQLEEIVLRGGAGSGRQR